MPQWLWAMPEIRLAVWGAGFNTVWEFAQSPLYTDHHNGLAYVLWTRLHCTAGDVMILVFSFWLVCILMRSRNWLRDKKPVAIGLFLVFGVAYTIFSEWLNVNIRNTWDYVPAMPTVLGIGFTPVLQWLTIPPLVLFIVGSVETIRYRALTLP